MPLTLGITSDSQKNISLLGLTWTTVSTGFDGSSSITELKYNGSHFLAGSSTEGRLFRSTDLLTWTSVHNLNFDNKGTPTYTGVRRILWTGSLWYIFSEAYCQIRISTNGINWTTSLNDTQGSILGRSGFPIDDPRVGRVIFNQDTNRVFLLDPGSNGLYSITTTNGTTWTSITHSSNMLVGRATYFSHLQKYYGNVSTFPYQLISSTNAISWTTESETMINNTKIYYDNTFGNTRYYSFDTSVNANKTSTNLITWTTLTARPNPLVQSGEYESIFVGNDLIIIGASSRVLGYNRKANSWTTLTAKASLSSESIGFLNVNNYLYMYPSNYSGTILRANLQSL